MLSLLSPKKAAILSIKIFQKPHFNKVRDREKDFLKNANIIRINHNDEDIIIYQTGNKSGNPILTVHGWDSNPGSMSGITGNLVKNGFCVYSLNVPAHGISEKTSTNMFETSDIIIKTLKKIGDKKPVSLVTHSFGSGAVSLALQRSNIEVNKMVFITSPDKLWDIFKDYADMIGLNDKAFKYMIEFTEQKFGRTFEQMQISKVLNDAKFNDLLLIHDKDDKILPFSNSKAIHSINTKSEIHSTNGKGHYRILWDDDVIKKITAFLE